MAGKNRKSVVSEVKPPQIVDAANVPPSQA